ncbi:MAG TPA: triose-phosphate isomerase [Nitrososphaerales archaeon]|nr:triose-phosphate isomerase [Nitrososphaerales archaeon]
MGVLILNFKNYSEILGDGSVRLAQSAWRAGEQTGQEVIAAPPTPLLGLVAKTVKVPVFAQGVSATTGEKTTGSIAPEAVKGAGATGTILNHSESRVPVPTLRKLIPRLTSLSLDVCLCTRTASEASRLAKFGTKYLAVEPPELIGSGVAVSKARPELVSRTVEAARKAGYLGKVLCGAGIVTGEDVAAAVDLGADGILVSSSVVKAKDWDSKLLELARSLG